MASTLFEAPHYDPARDRKRNRLIVTAVSLVVVLCLVLYMFRNWPAERTVKHFFSALQQKQYETAYGIWTADPDWKQHPERHGNYPFREFYMDWGPGGEWGVIHDFHVEGTAVPKGGGSGVVVVVTVNHIAGRRANLWVENKDKSLTFSPFETCDEGKPCT